MILIELPLLLDLIKDGKGMDSEGHQMVKLRRAFDTAEEFTCIIPGDSPRYLGIYYPNE